MEVRTPFVLFKLYYLILCIDKVYCQEYDKSSKQNGVEVTIDRYAQANRLQKSIYRFWNIVDGSNTAAQNIHIIDSMSLVENTFGISPKHIDTLRTKHNTNSPILPEKLIEHHTTSNIESSTTKYNLTHRRRK